MPASGHGVAGGHLRGGREGLVRWPGCGDMAASSDRSGATPTRARAHWGGRWRRLVPAVVLVVAACGGSSDPAGAPVAPASSAADDAAPSSGATPAASAVDELWSPTQTDQPFDLDGGAVSNQQGVVIDTDDPRSRLMDLARQVSEPWPTDWTRRTIELDELQVGLPRLDPRDGIPPIDRPLFEPLADATWLGDAEPGALVRLEGEVRFYPLSILTRHEIVNDRFGDVPVAVTFCPLCNTALAFDRRVDGEVLRFGVSGLLRNSDLVMWDDTTTSLWQQITGEALVGTHAGTRLEPISTSIVSYADAVAAFPDAVSLSRSTGFPIDYGANPYVGYSSSERPFLFDGEPDPRFPALSRVVGVSVDGLDKAYPFSVLARSRAVNDQVGEVPVVVLWGGDTADALGGPVIAQADAIGTGIAFDRRIGDQVLTFSPVDSPGSDAGGEVRFTDAQTGSTWSLLGVAIDGPLAGERLVGVTHRNEFWFAWAAFFPDAAVHG